MTKATKRLSKGKRSSWINSRGNWCLGSLPSSTSYLVLWEQRSWFLNYHSEPRVYPDASLPTESRPDFSSWYTNSFIMYVFFFFSLNFFFCLFMQSYFIIPSKPPFLHVSTSFSLPWRFHRNYFRLLSTIPNLHCVQFTCSKPFFPHRTFLDNAPIYHLLFSHIVNP